MNEANASALTLLRVASRKLSDHVSNKRTGNVAVAPAWLQQSCAGQLIAVGDVARNLLRVVGGRLVARSPRESHTILTTAARCAAQALPACGGLFRHLGGRSEPHVRGAPFEEWVHAYAFCEMTLDLVATTMELADRLLASRDERALYVCLVRTQEDAQGAFCAMRDAYVSAGGDATAFEYHMLLRCKDPAVALVKVSSVITAINHSSNLAWVFAPDGCLFTLSQIILAPSLQPLTGEANVLYCHGPDAPWTGAASPDDTPVTARARTTLLMAMDVAACNGAWPQLVETCDAVCGDGSDGSASSEDVGRLRKWCGILGIEQIYDAYALWAVPAAGPVCAAGQLGSGAAVGPAARDLRRMAALLARMPRVGRFWSAERNRQRRQLLEQQAAAAQAATEADEAAEVSDVLYQATSSECVVCLEPMVGAADVVFLACVQRGLDGPFHVVCARCWPALRSVCPLCRTSTTGHSACEFVGMLA